MKLTQKDYLTILEHYDIVPPKNTKGKIDKNKVKDEAEKILATKLCRCIKKVDKSTRNTNKKQQLKNKIEKNSRCFGNSQIRRW